MESNAIHAKGVGGGRTATTMSRSLRKENFPALDMAQAVLRLLGYLSAIAAILFAVIAFLSLGRGVDRVFFWLMLMIGAGLESIFCFAGAELILLLFTVADTPTQQTRLLEEIAEKADARREPSGS
jgi:hypothetical protein